MAGVFAEHTRTSDAMTRAYAILTTVVVMAMSTGLQHGPDDVPFYADKMDLLVYIEDGRPHEIKTVSEWQKRRNHILANMQLVMGKLPDESRHVPLAPQTLEEVTTDSYIRRKITFAAEAGDRVPAYLLIPRDLPGKAPAMLCLHQTTAIGKGEPAGLDGLQNLHYAHELAERGYVTLAPDYVTFGDYDIEACPEGYASGTMKGIYNHRRALDLLQSLPQVDGDRLGSIGHSLGGHNTLFVAAFDERIKVAVTSCGFNSFFKYMQGDLAGWTQQRYMPRIAEVYGSDPASMPFDFTEVLAAIAPRAVFVNAPAGDTNFEISGVKDCLKAARPVYALHAATDKLVASHPDCGHDFPPEVRTAAYEFVDSVLRDQVSH